MLFPDQDKWVLEIHTRSLKIKIIHTDQFNNILSNNWSNKKKFSFFFYFLFLYILLVTALKSIKEKFYSSAFRCCLLSLMLTIILISFNLIDLLVFRGYLGQCRFILRPGRPDIKQDERDRTSGLGLNKIMIRINNG